MRSLQTILFALFISLVLSACQESNSSESTETASSPQDETIVSDDSETSDTTDDGTPDDSGSQDDSGGGSSEDTTEPTPTPVAPPASEETNPGPTPTPPVTPVTPVTPVEEQPTPVEEEPTPVTEEPTPVVEEPTPVAEEEPTVVDEQVSRGAPQLTSATISGDNVQLSWSNANSDPDGGYDVWIDEQDTGADRTVSTSAVIAGLDLSVRHCFKVESRYVGASEFYVSNEMCTEAQAAVNQAPTIGGSPVTQVDAGTAYRFTPTANDADGDDLSYRVANQPSWASFNSSTGTLSGTPSAQDVGTYNNIRITVNDGTDEATLTAFSITVNTVEVAATTGSISLRWTAPTTRTDNTPLSLSDIDGYSIYVGTTRNNLQLYVDVAQGDATRYTINDIDLGDYYVAISAYDRDGRSSALSNIVMKSAN
jgi:outer membrane biosynthesis protein TonB